MKAPAFSYVRPQNLEDVIALMQEHGEEASLLAGGQTLHATLNMRLSEPGLLIDLQSVSELKGIQIKGSVLSIGAMVTHTEIEDSELIAQHLPLLCAAVVHIAHRALRNFGTFGGSIAYADPAAEWPACLLALDGVVVALGPEGERRIKAQDFFTGLYSTNLENNELIIACEFPISEDAKLFAFNELARRHGDYASVGIAASAKLQNKRIHDIRLAWLGAVSMPWRSLQTEAMIEGQELNDELIEKAVQFLKTELPAEADLTHSALTKTHLAGVMLKRALKSILQNH